MWTLYFQVFGVTFLLLGIFLLGLYLFRRLRRISPSRGGEIRVREVRPLDFKHRLVLVQVRDSLLLLGVSEKGITPLKEWSDESA